MKHEIEAQEPFFARFLEGQDYPELQSDVRAGRHGPPFVTLKYPSDDDEGGVEI